MIYAEFDYAGYGFEISYRDPPADHQFWMIFITDLQDGLVVRRYNVPLGLRPDFRVEAGDVALLSDALDTAMVELGIPEEVEA